MGITQFNPLLQILFPDAVKILEDKDLGPATAEYDHVLLDLNGLLYKLRAREQSDEALILATLKYLDKLLQQFQPKTTVVLALDGPSSFAKLVTASNRRANATIHTLRFTPGTEFMSKLKDALILFAGRYVTSSKLVKVVVSASDREGEGEYKLFEYLRNLHLHEGSVAPSQKRPRVLVMGNDTDLLLFSLRFSKHFEIDFLRVDVQQKALISTDTMRQLLLQGLSGDPERIILDFLFLTLLSGSDYTPRLGGYDYRRVYFHWRSLRMDPTFANTYILSPTTQQVLPAESSSHSSLPLPSDLSHYLREVSIDLQALDQILQGSNLTNVDKISLQIQHGTKLRDIRISQSDWKGNWNALRQAFCSNLKIESSTLRSANPELGYVCMIQWIDPTTNTRILAGEGTGVNARTAEYFAAIAACMPTSTIMTRYISAHISPEDFVRLSSSIVSVLDSLDPSFWQQKPRIKSTADADLGDSIKQDFKHDYSHIDAESPTSPSSNEKIDRSFSSSPSALTNDPLPSSIEKPLPHDLTSTKKSISKETQDTAPRSPHIFSAHLPSKSKIYALTKESKVLEEHDSACEELLRGIVWTILSFSAELPNGTQFYPYTRTPTVGAMQTYISKAHQRGHTIKVSIAAHPSEVLQDSSNLSITARHYACDALPPVQWFVAVTGRQSGAVSVLGNAAKAILQKIPILERPVTPRYTEEEFPTAKAIHQSNYGPRQILEKMTLENESKGFEALIRDSGLQAQDVWQSIKNYIAIRTVKQADDTSEPPNSLEELEPGLFRSHSSLLFFTHGESRAASSQDHMDYQAYQLRNSKLLESWGSNQLDLSEVSKRVSEPIKTWTGVRFSKVGCIEESSVSCESLEASTSENGFSSFARQHYRPFNKPKLSFYKRYYSTQSATRLNRNWRAQRPTFKSNLSRASAASTARSHSLRPISVITALIK